MADLASAARVRHRPELSQDIINKIQPVTLAGQRIMPVPEVLAPLFPWGGLQRGTSLGVAGHGAWTLSLALMAEALGEEGWLAVVGVPDLGLAAAADLGVRLDRVLLVETPSLDQWPTVVAALLEAVDVVAVAPSARIGPRDARRLQARAREQESMLLHLDGGRTWPNGLDLTLSTEVDRWEGLGEGHGHLTGRRVSISAAGRRGAGGGSSVEVWLPGPDGRLAAAPKEADVLEFRPLRESVNRESPVSEKADSQEVVGQSV